MATPYAAQGRVLCRARERAGKSLADTALMIGLGGGPGAAAGYERYERGEELLTMQHVYLLASFFGLDQVAFGAELMNAQ